MPHIPSASDQTVPATLQRVLTAALQCYLCGQTCGVLEAPAGAGLPPIAQFTPADGSASRQVSWQRLRCARCGSGSLMVEELEVVTRRIEAPLDLLLEKPRRGRPPRWLVELRARREAA
jgi:hypothetical protein